MKLPKVHKKSFGVESQVEVFELLKIPMESSVDLMEQKVHDLDNRLKQMKEERDQVIQENEELQEQLDMTNTNNSVGKSKVCLHSSNFLRKNSNPQSFSLNIGARW